MSLFSRLRARQLQPELMDDPELDAGQHLQALHGITRINGLSNSTGILWPPIRELAKTVSERPLRILDVATGAGDVVRRLYRRAQSAGVALDIDGVDISPVALEFAKKQAEAESVPMRFHQINALEKDLPTDYHVVTSSLFLHHLTEDEGVILLQKMKAATKHLLMINDLQRSTTGWLAAWIGVRILSRSGVVRVDGPRSVEGAFTVEEAKALADKAGLENAILTRHFPWRYRLLWQRTTEQTTV